MLWQSKLALNAIEAWIKAEKPALVELAANNEEIARRVADSYRAYMRYVSPILVETFKTNRDRIVEEVWQDACDRDGELGIAARDYPEWFRGTCRRVLNLFIQAAGGG